MRAHAPLLLLDPWLVCIRELPRRLPVPMNADERRPLLISGWREVASLLVY